MTKYSLLIGLLALIGCTAKGGDTGDTSADADTDTDTDTDTDEPVAFTVLPPPDSKEDCADNICILTVTTSREAGLVEVWIAETADEVSDPIWSETHNAFTLAETKADGSEVYELTLAWVTDLSQVDNESTLLNPDHLGATWAERLTWSFEAESADGSEFACWTSGQDTTYFADRCTNVIE